MKIKICGLQTPAAVAACVAAGADYLGFVFAPSRRQIAPELAAALCRDVPNSIQKVGVFVDEPLAKVLAIQQAVPLDIVQLHGSESPEYVKAIPVPVIKAFPVKDGKLPDNLSDYRNTTILLDAPPARYLGGNGTKFDWSAVKQEQLTDYQVMIAGGLYEENVQAAIAYFQPFGVDVSSGVETNGEKDHQKINDFIKKVRENDDV